MLIIPSKWKETFGFLELEALSYNCPVLVSEHVGSKEFIPHEYVFKVGNLTKYLNELSISNVVTSFSLYLPTFQEHTKNIERMYIKNNG